MHYVFYNHDYKLILTRRPITPLMMFDRKSAFWVTSTLLICSFVIFVILAVLVTPTPNLDYDAIEGSVGAEHLADAIQDLNNMVWWMTVGFIMLPIMLLLLVLAIFFLFTMREEGSPKSTSSRIPGFKAPDTNKSEDAEKNNDIKSLPSSSKNEAIDPNDALDLRYARGEITRDQYMDLQRELKKTRL